MSSADVVRRLAAAAQLVTSTLPAPPPLAPSPPIPGLAETHAHLLAQLRHTTTSLSLAYKPPASLDALAQQLPKLIDAWAQLAACSLAASGALGAEWAAGARALGADLAGLLEAMRAGLDGRAADDYLARTGVVWDAVDGLARASASEGEAVRRRWDRDGETVKDAWGELKEMLEEEEAKDGHEDEGGLADDDDDEWAELEAAMGSGRMSAQERARAEAAKPLLGLHQLLHPSLARYLPLLAHAPETSYAALLDGSAALLEAYDDAVAALHPAQDEAEVDAAVDALAAAARAVLAEVRRRLDASTAGDAAARAACDTFLSRWEARVGTELEAWRDRRFGMGALRDSL